MSLYHTLDAGHPNCWKLPALSSYPPVSDTCFADHPIYALSHKSWTVYHLQVVMATDFRSKNQAINEMVDRGSKARI